MNKIETLNHKIKETEKQVDLLVKEKNNMTYLIDEYFEVTKSTENLYERIGNRYMNGERKFSIVENINLFHSGQYTTLNQLKLKQDELSRDIHALEGQKEILETQKHHEFIKKIEKGEEYEY